MATKGQQRGELSKIPSSRKDAVLSTDASPARWRRGRGGRTPDPIISLFRHPEPDRGAVRGRNPETQLPVNQAAVKGREEGGAKPSRPSPAWTGRPVQIHQWKMTQAPGAERPGGFGAGPQQTGSYFPSRLVLGEATAEGKTGNGPGGGGGDRGLGGLIGD